MTSTEIAQEVGLHQSSASRILRTLIAAGYVRKPDYHSFAADYGVLALGAVALNHFPLRTKPTEALHALSEKYSGMNFMLVALWKGEVLYFHRYLRGREVVAASVGYPLHLSSPGMRLLLNMPEPEALDFLAESRARYGWDRPTSNVPATEQAVLAFARERLRHDGLVFFDWQQQDHVTSAISVDAAGEPPAALAAAGPRAGRSEDEILLILQEGRRAVENAMRV